MRRQSSYSVMGTQSKELQEDTVSDMQIGQFRKLGLPRRFSTPVGLKEEESVESRHQIQADQFVTKHYLERKGSYHGLKVFIFKDVLILLLVLGCNKNIPRFSSSMFQN